LVEFHAVEDKAGRGGFKEDAGTAGRFQDTAIFSDGTYFIQKPPGKVRYRRGGIKVIEDPSFFACLEAPPAGIMAELVHIRSG
jgi:hypothetical protein